MPTRTVTQAPVQPPAPRSLPLPLGPEPWALWSACSGSAAWELSLLGAEAPPTTYQGIKWKFRRELTAIAESRGFTGAPTALHCTDPGPWGAVLPLLLDAPSRHEVIRELEAMEREDARKVYDRLQGARTPKLGTVFAAEFLFLQRIAYSGKAVGTRDGLWKSPGFNGSSAYGVERTSRFGGVNPQVPAMIEALKGYDGALSTEVLVSAHRGSAMHEEAQRVPLFYAQSWPLLVYIDPPYHGTTAYPNGFLSRTGVINLARAMQERGATVMISEGEPLHELVREGWAPHRIDKAKRAKNGTAPFRSKDPEWVTVSPVVSTQRRAIKPVVSRKRSNRTPRAGL